jgi:hypothetical protein
MTLAVTCTEKRAGLRIASGPDPRPLVARTGPAKAADAARAQTLDVGRGAGTPR